MERPLTRRALEEQMGFTKFLLQSSAAHETEWSTEVTEIGEVGRVMGSAPERRESRRYQLYLVVRYRIAEGRSMSNWRVGTTREMSANGLSFRCRGPLPIGVRVELIINWPVKQDYVHPMYLHAVGYVVRSHGKEVGARMTFRRLHAEREVALSAAVCGSGG